MFAFVVTVPTVWLVLLLVLAAMIPWCWGSWWLVTRKIHPWIESRIANWEAREKAKIDEKYGQVDRYGE